MLKNLFFAGILKVNDEKSRIRIQDPDPLVRGMDPRIRIRIHPKMSWIRNTAIFAWWSKDAEPYLVLTDTEPGDPERADPAPDSNPQRWKIHYISCRLRCTFACSSMKSLSGTSMNIHKTKKYLIHVS